MESGEKINIYTVVTLPYFGDISVDSSSVYCDFEGYLHMLLCVNRSIDGLIPMEDDPDILLDTMLANAQSQGSVKKSKSVAIYREALINDIDKGYLSLKLIRASLKTCFRN